MDLSKLRRGTILIVALALAVTAACSKEEDGRKIRRTELTVIYTSDLHGTIRSCGCAAEDMGGLGRMATYIEKTRAGDERVLALSCGDDFSMELSFSRREADLIMDCYRLMGLNAITPGELEFIFGLDYLVNTAEAASLTFLASNLIYTDTEERVFDPPYIVKELDTGLRVGITGVLDDTIKFPGYIDSSTFRLEPAVQSVEKALESMKKEADFLILLSHMGIENTEELLREVPGFDIAIIGHKKPKIDKVEKVGETLMLAAGSKGQFVGKLEIVFSSEGVIELSKFQLVPLRNDIRIHRGVREIFKNYGIEITDKKARKKSDPWR